MGMLNVTSTRNNPTCTSYPAYYYDDDVRMMYRGDVDYNIRRVLAEPS
jgi:hypothetical protein